MVVDQEVGYVLRIGTNLSPEFREELLQTLKDFKDVFAYSASDMQGLDPDFASHELNINEELRPIKQKLRHQGAERNVTAVEEVKKKLLEAGIIEECHYTKWLDNVVLVKKASGIWHMCDFTDQNKP